MPISIDTEINKQFVTSYRQRYGHDALPSADAEASYNTVHLLALALAGADSVDIGRGKNDSDLPEKNRRRNGFLWEEGADAEFKSRITPFRSK